jgi:hypothetical protein
LEVGELRQVQFGYQTVSTDDGVELLFDLGQDVWVPYKLCNSPFHCARRCVGASSEHILQPQVSSVMEVDKVLFYS